MNKHLATLVSLSIASMGFSQTTLNVKPNTIEVNGKTASVQTIEQSDGIWGYRGVEGERFDVIVKNQLSEPTVIHWHGMELPNQFDGTEITQVLIYPTQSYIYDYPLIHAGTYWMHSHYGFQEQTLTAAPLIVYPQDYDASHDIVLMFEDFSFTPPSQIFAQLQSGDMNHMGRMKHGEAMAHGGMEHSKMDGMAKTDNHVAHEDLNDVQYDAFLTNRQTLDDPVAYQVKAGEKYRLRLINGSSSTNFWIKTGNLKAQAVAVDANDIQPLDGDLFQLAIAQRMDVEVTIPKAGGVFPIIAQVEGEKNQTGAILYTKGSTVSKIPTSASEPMPALNYTQDRNLHSVSQRYKGMKAHRTVDIILTGDMQTYQWKINSQQWPNITPIKLKQGEKIQFDFINHSEMAHPMHIHGHFFKVIAIDGEPLDNGPIRDTVLVKPHSTVSVLMIADRSGQWFMHCHMLYHMHAGMMTFLDIEPASGVQP